MRARIPVAALVTLSLVLPGIGCAPGEEAQEEVQMEAEEEAPPTVQEQMVVDTTAAAVWAHLQEVGYQENWSFWPGKEPFYQGTQPHGALLSTYLNDQAAQGLEAMRAGGEETLPFGSIVVKENYMPDSTLAAVTVMYKVQLYDPDHHDWWWMKRLADGTVEASGRVEGCIQCHQAAQGMDYLMTAQMDASSQ